jgi:hypothetical protein
VSDKDITKFDTEGNRDLHILYGSQSGNFVMSVSDTIFRPPDMLLKIALNPSFHNPEEGHHHDYEMMDLMQFLVTCLEEEN